MTDRMHDESRCDDAIHRLYEFLDGELTPTARMGIQKHLDDCLPCLEAFDFEAELRQLIADKCRDQVPDTLRNRIVSALQQEPGGSFGQPGPILGTQPLGSNPPFPGGGFPGAPGSDRSV